MTHPRSKSLYTFVLLLAGAPTFLGAVACSPTLPQAVGAWPQAAGDQGKCQVAASQNSPLVTEWPASEKANLEALLHGGAVAVAYSGCRLRVLSQCQLRGDYRWQPTTPATDVVEITNEDDLYAKLPLGAPTLEAELKRSGRLSVHTMVAGQLKLVGGDVQGVPSEGECAQATHIVSALSVGAFTLSTGAEASARAAASVPSLVEVGGGQARTISLLRSAGDANACALGTHEAPNINCASPIQVFLWPVPGRAGEEGPPGTIKVDFVSANPSSRWEVYGDDEVLCSTPCSRWVDPTRPLLLRGREQGFMSSSDKVRLASLNAHAHQGHLQVQAHGTAQGKLVTGITFSAFSGMAILTGGMLALLGCAGDRDGLCTGGLISMGAGSLGLAGSLWLLLDALPKGQVVPLGGGVGYAHSTGPRLLVSPAGVAGTF